MFKSIVPFLLTGLSFTVNAEGLTYEEGQRVFEADLWNEVYGRSYPYKIDKNVIITNSELKGHILTHYMTFYERKFAFKKENWEEGNREMAIDNFCNKPYIKYFPVTLRLKVTVKSDSKPNSDETHVMVADTKELCK